MKYRARNSAVYNNKARTGRENSSNLDAMRRSTGHAGTS